LTETESSEVALAEDLAELRLLLPKIIKGLRRHRPLLPADLEASLRTGTFSGRHFLALMHLAETNELSVGELRERLDVTLPTVSAVIHQLADYGLVQLREDVADRRRTLVSIAPSHREWVDSALAGVSAPLRRTLLQLEARERAALLKALRILEGELAEGGIADSAPHSKEVG
jgi:DNA-binding MarR family transcriptional regulator